LAILAAAAIFLPSAAHADSYVDYTVNGTFDSGGTLSGTFTLDTTSSTISSANLVADGVDFTCPGGFLGACYLYTTLDAGISAGFVTGPDTSQFLYLSWSNSADPSAFTLTTQVPGSTIGSYCEGCASLGNDFLVSGNALDGPAGDGTTSTPEPGTLLMLLAGLAGMGFLGLRRRGIATTLAS
jgi:hypothetical protein